MMSHQSQQMASKVPTNLPPGVSIQQRPKLPPGIQVQRTNSPPSLQPRPNAPTNIPNLPAGLQIQREPKSIPKLPSGISISQGGTGNNLPKSVSISKSSNDSGNGNGGGSFNRDRLSRLAGISISGGSSASASKMSPNHSP